MNDMLHFDRLLAGHSVSRHMYPAWNRPHTFYTTVMPEADMECVLVHYSRHVQSPLLPHGVISASSVKCSKPGDDQQ